MSLRADHPLAAHPGQIDSTSQTPALARFSDLVAQIESTKVMLMTWHEATAAVHQGHAREVAPLWAQWRRETAALADIVETQGLCARLNRVQQQEWSAVLCELVAPILFHDPPQEVKALYARHHIQPTLAEVAHPPAVPGADFDNDELLDNHERESARTAEARETTKAAAKARRHSMPRLREATEAVAASRALRSTFRRLASALHPDRATDAADRASRTTQMQRANLAYRKGDLLELLALQKEAAPSVQTGGAGVPDAQLALYNRALEKQLAGLQAQLREIEDGTRAEFGLGATHRPKPGELVKLLKGDKRALSSAITHLQAVRHRLADPGELLPWLKEQWTIGRGSTSNDD